MSALTKEEQRFIEYSRAEGMDLDLIAIIDRLVARVDELEGNLITHFDIRSKE